MRVKQNGSEERNYKHDCKKVEAQVAADAFDLVKLYSPKSSWTATNDYFHYQISFCLFSRSIVYKMSNCEKCSPR